MTVLPYRTTGPGGGFGLGEEGRSVLLHRSERLRPTASPATGAGRDAASSDRRELHKWLLCTFCLQPIVEPLMNKPLFATRLPILTLLLCAAFATAPAWSVPTTDPAELAALAARNRQERVTCMNLPDEEDRRFCVWDTNVAYAHAKRNRPDNINPLYAQNLLRRCDPLAGDERRDCLARMAGLGTTNGSVASGGIYRELVTIETSTEAPNPTNTAPPK